MKRNILLVILICCFAIMFTGCTKNTKTQSFCVKCGGIATTTLSGHADIIQRNGISLSDCKQITFNVYSADICDSCLGLVAKTRPDAVF